MSLSDRRRLFNFAILCLGLLSVTATVRARAACRPAVGRTVVLAHYMPWFEAKPASGQWGWHWTMNAFDPAKITAGRRSIASHYYPLIGPYDSGDPSVIEYHLLLMKVAGIDGVIVDWYGLSDLYDYPIVHRNTRALFEHAERLGMRVAICYEDHTIPTLVEQKRISANDRVKQAESDLKWVRENWFSLPAYLTLNGKPLLLSFGYSGLTDAEWHQVLNSMTSPPLYLSEHHRRSGADGSFDWPQPQAGLASLDTFYAAAKSHSIQMPASFPRFHDIYQQAKVHESYGAISDNGGRTLADTLERALKSGAPFVQLATWNDWGEGTGIEPTLDFGYRDLATILRLRQEPGVPNGRTPGDLRLPYRLWALRGHQAETPGLQTDLDRVATLISSGKTTEARSTLTRLEAGSR